MATLTGKKKTQRKLTETFAFSPGRAELTPWAGTPPPMVPGLWLCDNFVYLKQAQSFSVLQLLNSYEEE